VESRANGSRFVVVERDYMGELCQTWYVTDSAESAQEKLDDTADVMGWKFLNQQERAEFQSDENKQK
jgi:hypothetical protein